MASERQEELSGMVSDEALAEKLQEMLRTAELDTTTTADLRRRLEEHFGVELSDRKAIVRKQVNLFIEEMKSTNEGDKREVEEEGKEEEGGEDENEGDVEEEEQEDEKEASTSDVKRSGTKGSSAKMNAKRTGGGFTKVCSLSPQLQKFIGESELPRTQVVKRLWVYIRENNLQDPKNKRKIICNEKLHELFNVKTIDMFQMNKALTKHIWPLDPKNAPLSKSMEKETKEEDEAHLHKSKEKESKEEDKVEKLNSMLLLIWFHALKLSITPCACQSPDDSPQKENKGECF